MKNTNMKTTNMETVNRKDGLKVFLEKSTEPLSVWLNSIRKNGKRKDVFLAVGMVRGLQIALNYAKKHGNVDDVKFVNSQINRITKEKTEKQIDMFSESKTKKVKK